MKRSRPKPLPTWEAIASHYAGRPVTVEDFPGGGPLQATTGPAESGRILLGSGLRSGLAQWAKDFQAARGNQKQLMGLAAEAANPLSVLLHESMHNRHFDPATGLKSAWNEPQAIALGAELIPDMLHRFFGIPIDSPISRAYARAAKSRAEYTGAYAMNGINLH